MTIIPMRDLKDTVGIEKRCAEANGPVFVTKNGYGKLVVMDIGYYEKTLRKFCDALPDIENENVMENDAVSAKYGI